MRFTSDYLSENWNSLIANPTPEFCYFLESAISFYRDMGKEEEAESLKQLLTQMEEKIGMIVRGLEQPPEICDPDGCDRYQCSSHDNPQAWGFPCFYHVRTNEELKELKRSIEAKEKAFLESVPRNSKFGEMLDRLQKIEEKIALLETEPEKLFNVFPTRPNLCKPKSPTGEQE